MAAASTAGGRRGRGGCGLRRGWRRRWRRCGVETIILGGWSRLERTVASAGCWVRVLARKRLREAPMRMGRLNCGACRGARGWGSFRRGVCRNRGRGRGQFFRAGCRQRWLLRGVPSSVRMRGRTSSGARRGSVGQSWGRPRVCMRMAPQWSSAQVVDMAGSHRWPLTSLTISAPASMARRAVEAWKCRRRGWSRGAV